MLGLKLPTDPRWVNIVEKNIEEILTDHAYCEQKAASNAITVIVKFPEYPDVVEAMGELVKEEMEHFQMVHREILKRNLKLGRERKDEYIHDLLAFIKKGGSKEQQFVEKMLFGAMIEARSCERFRLLSENISDPELRVFYRELMESEARHYTMFLNFAKKHASTIDVDKRWQDFLTYEAELMKKYGKKETIHG
ncbi:tRNA 2-methylthio-N6-isopentenyl adenosine(37) hydroxylase MiaE [Brumimicrobium salinarum]|uniref:tRNA 2-methylthio-N6-isopentenyl adenosine(37) hydroxylase MiaE n=1 Tax=Brumimicrobium salinarum TaxID=2058658 RepID=A0A2I0R586_9FLAO|nr:tRNA-(ms[2]io[6]A)-hydroxylase [Brumimicrobium salinarum]PKR81751.1 tRNA 2-methylthio-N6-isopentenyl adenosine(37) hydroxylase MiaE [Brumimicrobium salinarum]